MGKPLVESEFDVADAATCFEYYGGLATKIYGDVNPVPDEALSLTLKEPVGVCAQIIPWNYPLMMAAWKIAPALAAGCTVVLKPAEATPLTALELCRILDGIDELPKGVVNVITGDGPVAGAQLAGDPDVDKIAFTGSTATGRRDPARGGGLEPEAGDAGAGRQVAQHLLRRRRLRGRHRRRPVRGVHQPGRGLLGRLAHPGRKEAPQALRRGHGGQGPHHHAGRSHGPRDQDGTAGHREAPRAGGRLRRGGPAGGRAAGAGRDGAGAGGQAGRRRLPSAHHLRRRRARA